MREELFRDDDGTLPALAWPGGYPVIYLTQRNDTLCPDCANREEKDPDSYDPIAAWDIYYEGPILRCDDCGKEIESAYGDPPH